MPRDGNGTYGLPTGYLAVSGEDILPEQHNSPLEDIATALTGSLPRNGTAAMTAALPMGGFKITGMADGTTSTDAVTKGQMDTAVSAAAIAPGITVPYAGSSAPSGWLLCNGQAVSRTTYAALFAIVATTYGTGDGSTTFNVPDLRGEFVRGLDGGRGVDTGRTLGSAQADELESHTHTATSVVADPGHDHEINAVITGYASGGGQINIFGTNGSTTPVVNATQDATTGITVATTNTATGGTETRPRNIALNFIIKT